LYLDCIKVYLDFNHNYNLVLLGQKKKKCFKLSESVNQSV